MLFSLRNRLIALFGLLLFCSLGLVYYMMFNESRAVIRAYIESSALEKMDEYGSLVRMGLAQIYDLSSIIFNSDMTHQWDAAVSDPGLPPNEKTLAHLKFSQFLTRTLNNYSGVSSITVYRKEGFWVGTDNRMAHDRSFLDETWYREFIREDRHWVPAHLDSVLFPDVEPYPVISLLLPIGTFKPALADSVMKVNVRAEFFQQPLNRIHLGENGSIFLLDAEGRPMLQQEEYHSISQTARQIAENRLHGSSEGVLYLTNEHGESEIMVYKTIKPYNWLLVGVVSEKELFAKLTGLRNAMIAWAGLLLAASVAAATWISHGITKPLSRLVRAIRHVQKGEFEKAEHRLSLPGAVTNEVAFVMQAFRNMIGLLQQHIRTEFQLKMLRQQAELKALLMQINPHFLFNTLELLSSLAMQQRTRDTVRVIEALGSMLRFSLKVHEECVPLQDELRYVQHYLDILRIRFRDRLSISVTAEGSLERVRVIKFVLQPLVENAVKFAASHKSHQETAVVDINVRRERDRIVMSVSDNGPGIPADLAERLRTESLAVQLDDVLNRPDGRIGLRNTLARCRLHYGDRFSFVVDSGPREGTRIELRLPVEEVDEDVSRDDRG